MYSNLTIGNWTWGGHASWNWHGADDIDWPYKSDYYGVIYFDEEGNMILKKGFYDEDPIIYTGYYDLALKDSEDMMKGMLVFDLYLESNPTGYWQPEYLSGAYITEARYRFNLDLYPMYGDNLFGDAIDFEGPYVLLIEEYDIFGD